MPITPNPEHSGHFAGPAKYDVISIQSQVIYGCVGNSIAVPALMQHGLRVSFVPTVILSNTPHYPTCYGGNVPVEWFEGFLKGLLERDGLKYVKAIVIGYIGSPVLVKPLAEWLNIVRTINKDIQVILDPVMGDTDCGYYVSEEINEYYRQYLLPMATGLTPNAFELACLCGKTISSTEETISAAQTLLRGNTQWVVVTSAAGAVDTKNIHVICVTRDEATVIKHARLPISPKGTGDLFSAELTAWILKGYSLSDATERACHQVEQSVLKTQLAESEELCIAAVI
ncbi:pyridoxine/pyridoxal/pyridoxamine kinase [Pectobacterium sp. B1J-3]|uniref:pyridoxine/pyridoxal/pyridoxamine kinase n=1 Tax=Pectobacterium sp. B1J-3 TaxID=3385371 RepID=UPI00390692BA